MTTRFPILAKRLTLVLFALVCGSINAYAMLDDDENGLSDVWEAIFGRDHLPGEDPDGDGFTNLEEQKAGTDPMEGNSYPRSPALFVDSDGTIWQTWSTIEGVHYQPWLSGDLSTWQPVSLALAGTGGAVTVSFIPDETFVSGGVAFQRWTGLTDWGLETFKSLVRAGIITPNEERSVDEIHFPQTLPDEDQFGQFITGWIVPPESGAYTFWITSDDQSELWFQTDSYLETLSLVANTPSWASQNEWDKFPEQQSLPILLEKGSSYRFEIFHRENGGGDHLTVAWTPPGMTLPDREILGGSALSSTGDTIDSVRGVLGHLFFRLEILAVDSDGDGLSDYEEAIIGTDPDDATTTPRVDDSATARSSVLNESVLTVGVDVDRGYEVGSVPVQFRVFRAGGIGRIEVPITFSGSATEGEDFVDAPTSILFGAGQREVTLAISPLFDGLVEPQETVTLELLSDEGYRVGVPATSTAAFDDARDELFVANLRPDETVTGSTAYGQAVLRRAGNGLSGELRLEFSGLQSNQTSAEVFFSTTGTSGSTWLTLPSGQVPSLDWDFQAEDGTAPLDVLAAIDAGNLWVKVRTEDLPDGEVIGRFVGTPAWENPVIPDEPPPAPLVPEGASEAARFLAQATFGATEEEAISLADSEFDTWITEQMNTSPTFHLPYYQDRRDELIARDGNDGYQRPRSEGWWQVVLTAPDQLRQRMAFALSQIFVISQIGGLEGAHEGTTLYYDMLVRNAFGNYRDILEEVTLSPMMGSYLSMIRNRKPDEITGHEPDENYAREAMQLFSIGLNRMHLDGTLMLDEAGMPIPTYDQDDIVGLAHVFTGWGAHYDTANPPTWSGGTVAPPDIWFLYGRDELRPMSFNANYHDTEDRTIVGGTLIPGTSSGEERMQMALDALFNHPNVAPFIAKQLIQKFVTSNPSPDYVYRVASKFEDNGSGVRGDLGATLRAVLVDYEARHPEVRDSISYGKGTEPLLRMARMMRLLPPIPPKEGEGDDRFFLDTRYSMPEQAPLFSPSVFNFYEPRYSSPGTISASGLLSPEFQILSETTTIRQANLLFGYLFYGFWTPEKRDEENNYFITSDLSRLVEILENPTRTDQEAQADLIEYLNQYLLFGNMSDALRTDLEGFFDELPSWYDFSPERQRERAAVAAYLVLTSPESFVQR